MKLWDIGTGREVATIYGLAKKLVSPVFSQDDTAIYSASEDGIVRAWRAPPP
jgi:WD40 repeat protein